MNGVRHVDPRGTLNVVYRAIDARMPMEGSAYILGRNSDM
jgi:hypothetical protein